MISWQNGIMNAAMNPVCAVTGLTMAKAMKDPLVFELIDALTVESTKVARVNEISLGWDYYPYAMNYLRGGGDHKPSMLMDIPIPTPGQSHVQISACADYTPVSRGRYRDRLVLIPEQYSDPFAAQIKNPIDKKNSKEHMGMSNFVQLYLYLRTEEKIEIDETPSQRCRRFTASI